MKLYTSIGPNPRVVNMFIAEKGIEIERESVDLLKGENRQEPHLSRNPAGQTPALQLDDGRFITEITAICEYLDDKHPTPPMIGTTPEERAETHMWVRRIDLNILEPLANGFRYSQGLPLFQSRMKCIPQAADDLKGIAQEKLTWLDGLMAGRKFVCGERITLADVMLYCFLEFGASVGQPINEANANIGGWLLHMRERPSAKATAG